MTRGSSGNTDTWGFGFVGNDATNKVRLRGTQGRHELVQLFLNPGSCIDHRVVDTNGKSGNMVEKWRGDGASGREGQVLVVAKQNVTTR